jgi:hypothetical protein
LTMPSVVSTSQVETNRRSSPLSYGRRPKTVWVAFTKPLELISKTTFKLLRKQGILGLILSEIFKDYHPKKPQL